MEKRLLRTQTIDIEEIIHDLNLTQEEFITPLKVSQSYISTVKNRKKRASEKLVGLIEEKYNLNIFKYMIPFEPITVAQENPIEYRGKKDYWFSADIDDITDKLNLLRLELVRLQSVRNTKIAEIQAIDRQIQSTKDMIDNKDWTS